MPMSAAEAESAIRSGIASLRQGHAAQAQRLFQEVIDRGSPLPPPWFMLAQACRHSGDDAAEGAALDKVLENQPRNIGALIMKGDLNARNGDKRAAGSFYRTALSAAAGGAQLPRSILPELRRIEVSLEQLNHDFGDYLEERLTRAGATEAARTDRLQMSLDIMLGRKQLYLQQPTSFYFTGLPHIQFYERADFPWLAEMEAAIADIRTELQSLIEDDESFTPYIEADPNRPPAVHRLLGDPSWSAFHFFKEGEPIVRNVTRCPRTAEALGRAPLPRIRGRSPMALFSLLRGGAHIAPHSGLFNTRLICHIPVIVPPNCRLRVGNEVREWEEGKALIFDDSIEHEAWNGSDRTRTVLLFEIWRPEIGEEEQRALTIMFEAITDYGGGAAETGGEA